jgi:hypothetical protein
MHIHTLQSLRRAKRIVWWVGFLLIFTTIVGRAWDGWWHITYPFDGFWAPPHVFVYGMTTLVGLLVGYLVFNGQLRSAFGSGFAVPGMPFAVPGSLFLLGGGLVALSIAGVVLDNIWHTRFGLNETAWSLPHAMIGTSLVVVTCGYVACSYALRGSFGPAATLFYGFLLVAVFQVILGPIGQNNTAAAVQALARVPALAAQPAAQASFYLCVVNNLTRSNPLLILLGAGWLGISLAAVRGLSERAWPVLAVSAIWTLLSLDSEQRGARWLDQFGAVSADAASWLPLPLLPAALAWACCRRIGWQEHVAWAAAGMTFGICAALIWRMGAQGWLLVPLAAPLAAGGAELGKRVAATIRNPLPGASWALLLYLAVLFPLLTGAVDLYLRWVG